jgi:AraC-like DNA-binding protein
MDGRRIWHTAHGSFELQKGSCVFVRKGASLVEHFMDSTFCVVVFFVPDDFICEVLQSKSVPIGRTVGHFDPVIAVDNNEAVHDFFQSMRSHFDRNREPDAALLELKFKELILTIADNPANGELLSLFYSLLQQPQGVSLQRVMEDNFCFNLGLADYARLSARSLSAFKRDFQRLYKTSPGKWLIEKRLNHALHLLTNLDKTVSETAFESGFESASHFSRAFRQRFGSSPISMKQQVVC